MSDSNPQAGPSKPRLRANKACENCRLRKIRCSGQQPCQACISTAIPDSCFIRDKARPSRPAPAIVTGRNHRERSTSTSPRGSHHGQGESSVDNVPAVASVPHELFDNTASSYWSAFGHMASENPHHLSFLDTVLPHPPPTRSPEQIFHFPTTPQQQVPQRLPRAQNPLFTLESLVREWCAENHLPLDPLIYHDEARIACLEPTPLPAGPALISFEDGLMGSLVMAEDIDHLQIFDSTRIVNLYSRYRALPKTLTGDETALVYASLCLARHIQLRGGVAGGMLDPQTSAREDVTYYRMARSALAEWGRSSTISMCALFCMVRWVQIHGGCAEYGEITAHWAWQIRELGLHKQVTAQLYPPQDMSETLLASYCYSETLRAIMTDLRPAIPVAELELGPNGHPNGIVDGMARASNHAVKFLRDYADPAVDITSVTYLAASEEQWSDDLDYLRTQNTTGMLRIKHGWAEMRLHWLRFLLHIPRLVSSPGRAALARSYILRSATHILYIHSEAAQMGRLDPSWLQLKRILTCGQVLIVCCARREVPTREASGLFGELLSLLQAHVNFWPVAEQAVQGYREAAARLGVPLDHQQHQSAATMSQSSSAPHADNDIIDWSGLFLDMDLDAFVQNTESGLLG